MTISRIIIVLIFLIGMLTGCGKPLIDVQVEVHSGVQPGSSNPPGPGPGCPPGTPWYLCGGGGCPPGIPWWACGGGGTTPSGVVKKIYGTEGAKIYEVEIEGPVGKLYFSVPPDDVEPGIKENDQVFFNFDDKNNRNKLSKPK